MNALLRAEFLQSIEVKLCPIVSDNDSRDTEATYDILSDERLYLLGNDRFESFGFSPFGGIISGNHHILDLAASQLGPTPTGQTGMS